MNPTNNHDSSIPSVSSIIPPSTTAAGTINFPPTHHPRFAGFSGKKETMLNPSPWPQNLNSPPLLAPRLCSDKPEQPEQNKGITPKPLLIKGLPQPHNATREFDPNIFPFVRQVPPGFMNYNGLYFGSQNMYRYMNYPYGQGYMNGCRPYPSPTPAATERLRLVTPSLKTSHSLVDSRDPLMEHNYIGHNTSSEALPKLDHPIKMGSVDGARMGNLKRAFCSQSYGVPLKLEEHGAASDNVVPKKKKNYAVDKELLQKPMTVGFEREVVTTELHPGDPPKRSVVYSTPDRKQLNRKQEVKLYLMENPGLELRPEHFSFDTRLSLNSKRNSEGRKVGEKKVRKRAAADPQSSGQLSQSQTPKVRTSKVSRKAMEDSPGCDLGLDVSIRSNGFKRKCLSMKLRKVILKYFKKQLDNSKFLDGLAAGSYRRKLPVIPRPSCYITVDGKTEGCEVNSVFSDITCVGEFLLSFASYLSLPFDPPSLTELFECLKTEQASSGLYFKILKSLMKQLIIVDGFASFVNSFFHLDNIHSIDWDWLIVHELARLYISTKVRFMLELDVFSDCLYIKNLKNLSESITKELIYSASPQTMAFALRFVVDQLVSSNKFSSIINEIVDDIGKCRRDKYHLDTKIRQLKQKNYGTSSTTKSSTVPTASENPANGTESQTLNASNNGSCKETENATEDHTQLDKERDHVRSSIKEKTFTLRCLFIGSDRFGRDYHYSANKNSILVEGNAEFISSIHSKNTYRQHPKKLFPSGDNILDTVGMSKAMFDKMGLKAGFEENTINGFKIEFSDSVSSLKYNIDSFEQEPRKYYMRCLMKMLIDNPKFIRHVTEDDLDLFVDAFTKNYMKNKKKAVNCHEYSDGWWEITTTELVNDFIKCCNQRGIREHNLFKNFTRNQEYLAHLAVQESKTISLSTASSSSIQSMLEQEKSLIVSEVVSIAQKMDKYLDRLGISPSTDTNTIHQLMTKYTTELPEKSPKDLLTNVVTAFVGCCERKFDRPWLCKWNESLENCSSLTTVHLFAQALKIKIDPNSKMCHVCHQVDEEGIVVECSMCLVSAHESCLEEPMKKYKKSKLICSSCMKEFATRKTRACKLCNIKSGKTVCCAVCNEFFHTKCLGVNKQKTKADPVVCEACYADVEERAKKVFKRPPIDFVNSELKPHTKSIERLLTALKQNKDAKPFLMPVDTSVPTYYEIIKKPMDFQTISRKLKTKKYKFVTEFYEDVFQIFENCQTFNEEHSKIGKCGARLQKMFEKEWKQISAQF